MLSFAFRSYCNVHKTTQFTHTLTRSLTVLHTLSLGMQIWPGPSMQASDSQEGRICHYSEYGERTGAPCLSGDAQMFYI